MNLSKQSTSLAYGSSVCYGSLLAAVCFPGFSLTEASELLNPCRESSMTVVLIASNPCHVSFPWASEIVNELGCKKGEVFPSATQTMQTLKRARINVYLPVCLSACIYLPICVSMYTCICVCVSVCLFLRQGLSIMLL